MPQASCLLSELTQGSSGIGTWTLRVVKVRVNDYEYIWQGQEKKGKKFECILLSDDSNSYCTGLIKRSGKTGAADQGFNNSVAKFKEDTIWNMSHITLTGEKQNYIGSPVKYVIDLTKTKVSPVLHSTTFPKIPTPPDSLATIVQLPRQQKVDFLAIVRSVLNQRHATTARGERTIVDVTFMDGSTLENGKVATITVAMFFPKTKIGDDELQRLQNQDKPVCIFGVLCTPQSDKMQISCGPETFWCSCTSGTKAEHLMEYMKQDLNQQETQEIAANSFWKPQEARDFKAETATQTCCAVLQAILNQTEQVTETLFQLNHVRICEPGCGENIKTNDGARLFVPVRLMDWTGSVNLRMREQAALELSGHSSADEFEKASREACLRFPVLSSVRVLVRPKTGGASEQTGSSQSGGASDHTGNSQAETVEMQAILVEALEQPWDAQHAPNAAANEFSKFLQHLPIPSNRVVAARIRDITNSPHAGMRVKMNNGREVLAEYALVLICATEKSGGQAFGSGYKVITKNVRDCDIWDDGSDVPVTADCVSICTTDNLLHYKVGPLKPGTVQYAVALVSGLSPASGSKPGTIMLDAVQLVNFNDLADHKKVLRKLMTLAMDATFSATPAKRAAWSPSFSPFHAKKARKLACNPTDASLPDSAPTPSDASLPDSAQNP